MLAASTNFVPKSPPADASAPLPKITPLTLSNEPLAPAPDSPFGGGAPEYSQRPAIYQPEEQDVSVRSAYMPMPSGIQWPRIMQQAPVAKPQAVLQAKGLCKKFGRREVVRGVDIEIGAGEIVGLLGRNGAGKTTTFRMIMGLLHPDSGAVTYESRDITRLPMYKRANRGIGYLAQQPSIFQRMNVEDNLLAILELQEPDRRKRMATLEELIKNLGLATVRKSPASVLSGGERRRLEIARAMSLNPRIVLFDEPFAGIDPIAVSEIQGILKDLKARGVGVLLTDHNVRETLTITDRTYIMDEGKIWIHGPPREIVANVDARARYLGHDFRLDF
jgi:lipopolysaccharide export system ATP-binding protein